jgi:recombination protein RecT
VAGKTITNAVAERDKSLQQFRAEKLAGLKVLLDQMAPEIARALPAHLTPERMLRITLTQARAEPKLLLCTPESMAGAVLTCAQVGMEPGPTGEAFFIPRKNRDTGELEAKFELGYKGMAKLFWQHPLAKYLNTATVRVNDEFDYDLGSAPYLKHKPNKGDRGEPAGHWYAVYLLTNGGFGFAMLDKPAVQRRRNASSAPNSPGWSKNYNEMAEKSALRDAFDTMPKSAEMARALAWDGAVRTNLDLDAIDDAPTPEEPDEEPAEDNPLHYDDADAAGGES